MIGKIFMKFLKKKNIYLDYASTAPISPSVAEKTSLYQKEFFANASAIYSQGVKARGVMEDARLKIAKLLNAHSDEIIFTGSGTESDALAILGLITNYELGIKSEDSKKIIPHIVTTNIEHPAVLENCRMLEDSGRAEVTYVPVEKNGIVDPKKIKEALKENTILVSVMYANNEIGTIEPIEEIAKEIRHFRKGELSKRRGPTSRGPEVGPLKSGFPLFHTDACQAMNYLFTENIEKLGVDLLSFNGSKIYGPKGSGVLYKKRGVQLSPIYKGGGQEFGLRSGTENLSAIIGVSSALVEVSEIKERESIRLIKLRDYTIDKLLSLKVFPFKITLNGDASQRLPNNINISISGISSELLVLELDAFGIQVSEKSACHSSDENSSYVIKAIRKTCGRKKDSIEGSLRISLGRGTTKKELDYFVVSLYKTLNKYKKWK